MNVTKMLQAQVHAGWLLCNTQIPQNDCLHLGSCCQLNCNHVFQRELLTLLWLCHRAFILRGIKLGVTSLQLHLSFRTGRWPQGGRALIEEQLPSPAGRWSRWEKQMNNKEREEQTVSRNSLDLGSHFTPKSPRAF